MSRENRGNQEKGFTLIEVMVVAVIISLLAAIAIPNYIRIRNKGYCSQAENDANMVVNALSDYFANPFHNNLPLLGDLHVAPMNPVQITGDPNETISVIVTDQTGRCPDDYQRADKFWNWQLNTYTKEID